MIKMFFTAVILFLGCNFIPIWANPVGSDVCETEACVEIADLYLEYMDPTVNPCDDFYQFSCGKFLKDVSEENKDNEEAVQVNVFSPLLKTVESQLRSVIKDVVESKPESNVYQLIKTLYDLCQLKLSGDDQQEIPYQQVLKEVGPWPLIGDKWEEDSWSLENTEVRLKQLGIGGNFLFTIFVDNNDKDCTKRLLELEGPKLGIGGEVLMEGLENPQVQQYLEEMKTLVNNFDIDPDKVVDQLNELIQFEIELAKINTPSELLEDHEKTNNLFTLEQLKERVDWIDWDTLLIGILPEDVKLQEDDLIKVIEPEFYDRLHNLLEQQPREKIANYIMGRAGNKIYSLKVVDELKPGLHFNNPLVAYSEEAAEEFCIEQTKSLSTLLAALYVNKYFNDEDREPARHILQGLQEEMSKNIHKLSWMDEDTKLKALDKVAKIRSVVGYHDDITDINKLEEYYKDLNMSKEFFLNAELDLVKWDQERSFRLLHTVQDKVDLATFGPQATVVNAFYSAVGNVIVLPAAIMQPTIFNRGYPSYVNYARLGAVLGHELSHGFDNQGAQYDGDGNLNDWWDKSSQKNFGERMKCLINQYNNFHINGSEDLEFNGEKTQGENVADVGGINLAYQAYKSQYTSNPPRLPGLDGFNLDQLFALSYGNLWCAWIPKEEMKLATATDPHPLAPYRVNGVLSDWPEFGRIFQCAPGTPMNPKKKCTVW